MDIDMHFYGTLALARAAGLRMDVAHRIATAAEFVDDSTETEVIVHSDGARFRGESTAHHPTDLKPINDLDDQPQVWVPFHFLPGGNGKSQSQKLVCRKNSLLAQEMIAHHLGWSDRPFAIELLGIAAHVYADTLAHYGFSGVSSRLNRVDGGAIALLNGDPNSNLLDRFFEKFGKQGGLLQNFRTHLMSNAAENMSGALGHGAVATFPDQPYLEWSYVYEHPDLVLEDMRVERQNLNDFMEGAKALHRMFCGFAANRPDLTDKTGGFDFERVEPKVREILVLNADRDRRIRAWKAAFDDGVFSRTGADRLPDYDSKEWRAQTRDLGKLKSPALAKDVPAYHFHHAAALHRNYVLRELLPKHDIFLI